MTDDTKNAAIQGAATGAATGNPYMAIAGAALPVLGGLFGSSAASDQARKAERARSEALGYYNNISIPEVEQMMLNLSQYQTAGTLDPFMEQVQSLGPSAFEELSTDPRLREQQMNTISQMNEIATKGGTDADRAAFQLARQSAAGEQQARQNQIIQEMQQRGQGGSGAELLARLTANQSGAQMLQQAQLQEAQRQAQARQAALRDLSSATGNLRSQDFSEGSAKASARDVINQFNAQNAQSVGARNVGAKNQAQQANLTNLQDVMNKNTSTANTQQQYNKELNQQNFTNQMNLAGAKANIKTGQAAAAQQNATNTAAQWATIGQGAGTALNSYLNNKK